MKLELNDANEKMQLCIRDLKEGDIAIITDRYNSGDIIKIVRIDGKLKGIFLNKNDHFPDIVDNDMFARLLVPGETLVVSR